MLVSGNESPVLYMRFKIVEVVGLMRQTTVVPLAPKK